MFSCPSDIFRFHSFCCPLTPQLGSLRQKCDPGRRAQNSHKNLLCVFAHQTFSILIPLIVPWGPNLDPCGKSVILTSARKMYIKVVYVFFYHQTFSISIPLAVPLVSQLGSLLQKCDADRCEPNSHKSRLCFLALQTFPIFIPLVVPWGPSLDPCGKSVILTCARKIHKKIVYVFCPSEIVHVHSFGCPLEFQLGSLQQKCDPDRRAQKSHKSRLCFFAHQTFSIFIPLAVLCGPNLDPCSKSVLLTRARKIHTKVVYVFLPIMQFPFSILWLFHGVPIWILAAIL